MSNYLEIPYYFHISTFFSDGTLEKLWKWPMPKTLTVWPYVPWFFLVTYFCHWAIPENRWTWWRLPCNCHLKSLILMYSFGLQQYLKVWKTSIFLVVRKYFIRNYFLDLYRMANDPRVDEGLTMHKSFSQTLLQDHFRASQLPEHHLIDWTDGPFPPLPASSTPASSSTSTGRQQSSSWIIIHYSNNIIRVVFNQFKKDTSW